MRMTDVLVVLAGSTIAAGALVERAVRLMRSDAVRAFDLSQESDQVRDAYGKGRFGQGCLLARRLVEHGVPLVSVNWHNDGQNFWDTHGNNFKRLKRDLRRIAARQPRRV